MRRPAQPVLAGIVSATVGFAGSFTVVLAGLRAVGADERQSASGLLALCLALGLTAVGFGLRLRAPVAMAWSTPGAALLVSTGPVTGGFRAAVGAFLLTGPLIAATSLIPGLGRRIAAIPAPLASAMLAGVLLELCLAPARAVAHEPATAVPVVLTWAIVSRPARAWAVPAALAAAVVAVALTAGTPSVSGHQALPSLTLTVPTFTTQALVSITLPLLVVTMTAQNIPGMTVLAGYGFHPPLRPLMAGTGLATVLAAPFGGHAVNLAAITAALTAGPDADPDPERRWIASVANGLTMIVYGLGAGVATAVVLLSPPVLIEAVAGLALLGPLAGALSAAVADPGRRESAIVTFAVTASGITLFSVGAAFWGLIAGALMVLLHRRRPREPAAESGPGGPDGVDSIGSP
jgi:benzoate membrane transport protein